MGKIENKTLAERLMRVWEIGEQCNDIMWEVAYCAYLTDTFTREQVCVQLSPVSNAIVY